MKRDYCSYIKTNATRFLIPMLIEDEGFFWDYFSPTSDIFFLRNSLINAYIDKDKYEILLYYKYDKLLDWPIFERKLEHMSTYISDKDSEHGTIFLFKVPDKFHNDFDLFKQGLYSQFSDKYKKHLLKFYNRLSDKSSLIYKSIYALPEMMQYVKDKYTEKDIERYIVKGEVWFKPIIYKEILVD